MFIGGGVWPIDVVQCSVTQPPACGKVFVIMLEAGAKVFYQSALQCRLRNTDPMVKRRELLIRISGLNIPSAAMNLPVALKSFSFNFSSVSAV